MLLARPGYERNPTGRGRPIASAPSLRGDSRATARRRFLSPRVRQSHQAVECLAVGKGCRAGLPWSRNNRDVLEAPCSVAVLLYFVSGLFCGWLLVLANVRGTLIDAIAKPSASNALFML